MYKRRSRMVLAFVVLTASAGLGLADDARNKPKDAALDDELLEFLGSVDTASDASQLDDGTWIEYLSQTDIGKVAAAKPANPTVVAAKPAAPATPPPAPKPDASGAKQDE